MIIDFSVANYKSIKDEGVLTFAIASHLTDVPGNLRSLHLAGRKQAIDILTTIGLYGANASGKSTVLEALNCVGHLIRHSATKYNVDDVLPITPFLLDGVSSLSPSTFQISFVIDSVLYQYGFSADKHKIHDEWLYFWPKGRERLLFRRKENIYSAWFKRHSDIKQATRSNALLVSTGALLNQSISLDIVNYFSKINYISSIDNSSLKIDEAPIDEDCVNIIINMLKYCDIGIDNIYTKKIKEFESNIAEMRAVFEERILDKASKKINLPEYVGANVSLEEHDVFQSFSKEVVKNLFKKVFEDNLNKKILLFKHKAKIEDSDSAIVSEFTIDQESDGTIKYIYLLNAAIKIFKSGGILLVDEIDSKLHPILSSCFLKFVQGSANQKGQLIFSAHSSEILDADTLRRDQIYLSEKNYYGETTLTNLSDFKVRKDAVLSKRYIEGRYGGIPHIHEGYLEEANKMLETMLAGLESQGDS